MPTHAKFRCRAVLFSIIAVIAQFPASGGANAFADEAVNPQAALSKAYNDYYKALQAQPDMTQAEKTQLFNKLSAPAQEAVNKAVVSQTQETLKNVKPLSDPTSKWGPPPAGMKPSKQPLTPANLSNGLVAAPEPTHRPETVLDGSKIPREIEFSGPKKATPSPTSAVPH